MTPKDIIHLQPAPEESLVAEPSGLAEQPPITERAEWTTVELHLPGRDALAVGVLLRHISTDHLYIRLRADWTQDLGEDSVLWQDWAADLQDWGTELGAGRLLDSLQDASHTLRIGARQQLLVCDCAQALQTLYREHIEPTATVGPDLPIEAIRPSPDPPPTDHPAGRTEGRSLAAAAGVSLATLVLSLVLTAHLSPGLKRRVTPKPAARIDEAPALALSLTAGPIYTLLRVDPVFPEAEQNASHRSPRRAHRRFRPPAFIAKPSMVPVAEIRRPASEIAAPGPVTAPLPIPSNIVDPPPYRSHRNRVLRTLTAVMVPFRALFSPSASGTHTLVDSQ